MKKNKGIFGYLVTLLMVLMFCTTFILPGSIQQVRADSSLPDKAVDFIKTDYQNNGAGNTLSVHYPYVAYILNTAGVDWKTWEHDNTALQDAVLDIVDSDIKNSTAPVKYLAEDLILMQAIGDNALESELETLLHNRQSQDGSFQDDTNAFSIIPAYELLGRAGELSVVDTIYARDYILGQQNTATDSGAWTKDWADFIETAQAVRALNYLAPGAASDSPEGQAVAEGCNWLKQRQQTDGSFNTTFDDALIDTAEAIFTQKALGLDPASAWTSGGKSAVDYLNDSALNADGSFGDSKNVMDAAWALDSFTSLGINPSGGSGGGSESKVSVRVRVEGAAGNLADTTVAVSGSALDALKSAVGSDQVAESGGFVTSIKGESGQTGVAADTDTGWFFYAMRNGAIDEASLSSGASRYSLQDGDQIVFYIGAYGHTTYAPKTYLPIVSISPQTPSAGQSLTISISAQKYDWSSGLQDLTGAEIAAIGEYSVTVGENDYTSQAGQVTVPSVSSGTLTYSVTNYNSAGYPNVVRYRGSITVGPAGGSGSSTGYSVGVAIVGSSGELLYGPNSGVPLPATNKWGQTVLGALDATGVTYTMSSQFAGFVNSIAGQSNSGQQGWMFTVNGSTVMKSSAEVKVYDNDKVIWYYSKDMNQAAPTWEDLIKQLTNSGSSKAVDSTSGKATLDPAAGGTVGQGTDAQVVIPAGALSGSSNVEVAVSLLTAPPSAPSGFMFLGQAYEFTVAGSQTYKFNKPVTLTFAFNPATLLPGQEPAIYYYDSAAGQWVKLGGTVSGNTISVSVDHFTRFAVLAALPKVSEPQTIETDLTDIKQHWAKTAIEALINRGAIGGYKDGSFKPDNQITRAEFVAILNKALPLPSYTPPVPDFNDVSSSDWFYEAAENAVHAGIIKGYGGAFNPNQVISREEIAVILVNALGKNSEAMARMSETTGFTDDAGMSAWSKGFVITAVQNGLMNGYADRSIKPGGNATRAEACTMIMNLLNVRTAAQ